MHIATNAERTDQSWPARTGWSQTNTNSNKQTPTLFTTKRWQQPERDGLHPAGGCRRCILSVTISRRVSHRCDFRINCSDVVALSTLVGSNPRCGGVLAHVSEKVVLQKKALSALSSRFRGMFLWRLLIAFEWPWRRAHNWHHHRGRKAKTVGMSAVR